LIATVKHGLARERRGGGITVLRTMFDMVWKAASAGWTFFHDGLSAESGEKFIKASHTKKRSYETLIYLRPIEAVKKNSNAAGACGINEMLSSRPAERESSCNSLVTRCLC
jgi:hypothetical protein